MKNVLLLVLALAVCLNIGCGEDEIPGCTDINSDNYNSEATVDDGTCFIRGCTDPSSQNFNPDATQDDGTCMIPGCTDPLADNYNPNATEDDGSCVISGCTDATADNYNPDANSDDGTCIYSGCTDVNSDQYDATANQNDGSCSTYFDRWSAAYSGSFECEGELLNAYFGEATFTFSKADISDNLDSMDVFVEFSLSDIPLSFRSRITRDTMYANAFFPEYQTDVDIVPAVEGEVFDISISGKLNITENNEMVSGFLTLGLEEKALGIGLTYEDSCVFDGTKD